MTTNQYHNLLENFAKGDGDQVCIKLSDDRSQTNTQATFKVESWSFISSK